jgi:hypothetical protein
MGKEDQKCPLSMKRPTPPAPSYLLSHPNIQNLLMGAFPFTDNDRKRASLCPLPAIRAKGN